MQPWEKLGHYSRSQEVRDYYDFIARQPGFTLYGFVSMGVRVVMGGTPVTIPFERIVETHANQDRWVAMTMEEGIKVIVAETRKSTLREVVSQVRDAVTAIAGDGNDLPEQPFGAN